MLSSLSTTRSAVSCLSCSHSVLQRIGLTSCTRSRMSAAAATPVVAAAAAESGAQPSGGAVAARTALEEMKGGAFVRKDATFRNWIKAGSEDFPPEGALMMARAAAADVNPAPCCGIPAGKRPAEYAQPAGPAKPPL